MITELEFKSLAAEGYNRIPLIAEAFRNPQPLPAKETKAAPAAPAGPAGDTSH